VAGNEIRDEPEIIGVFPDYVSEIDQLSPRRFHRDPNPGRVGRIRASVSTAAR
jgi:hypothetical protein